MKFKLLPFSIVFAFALATTSICGTAHAAPGDLYSGQLSVRSVEKFTPAGVRSTFAAGPFADWLAFDSKGNLFASDTEANTIVKITPTGSQTTFGSLIEPAGLAFDNAGSLFAADASAGVIYKYAADGSRTVFAEGLSGPRGLAFDPDGNLFVSETDANRITKITTAGTKTPFASNLATPLGLAFDTSGNLYEVDFSTGKILKFTPTGARTVFARRLAAPRQLAFDKNGDLFVANFATQVILKITPAGTKTTFATNVNAGGLAFEPATAFLANISTRLFVQTGDNVEIGGFIVTGTDNKRVVIRGRGPSLPNNVGSRLANPTLELHNSTNALLATNDNWKINGQTGQSQQAEVEATTVPPDNDLESAIVATLAPGSYTAVLAGKDSATGVGIVEVYDLNAAANSTLANISTRGFVQTGSNVMIGGFILNGGNGFGHVIIRAIGPALPVASKLANPTLELHDVNGALLATNDNWKTNDETGQSQEAEVRATGVPPENDLESVIVATIPVGQYTAIVAGKNGGTGVGLVEVFNLR